MRTYHERISWLVTVDGRERRIEFEPIDWRHFTRGRDVLVDGEPVKSKVVQSWKFPYGPVTDREFAIGSHACVIRYRESRIMGNPETLVLVDGDVVDTRTPEDEAGRNRMTDLIAWALLATAGVVIAALYGPSLVNSIRNGPMP